MSCADEELKSSVVWNKVKHNRNIMHELVLQKKIAEHLVVDDWLSAVNVGIAIRDLDLLSEANSLFERLLSMDANSAVARFEYSISLSRSDRHADALHHARIAATQSPDVLRFILQYVMLLANAGDEQQAARQLNNYVSKDWTEMRVVKETHQFARYLRTYPRTMADAVIREISASSRFRSDEEVADSITRAISKQTPFSLLRLGDGEGAWLFMDNLDEENYSELYSSNRTNFLRDWFGSDDAATSNEFFAFARDFWTVVDTADIIGIPDQHRIAHEYRLLSRRGIPSCINVFRKLGLLTESSSVRAGLTSNNVHRHLEQHGFYKTLWGLPVPFGIITSQRALPGLLVEKLRLDLRFALLTPGDSRNFWIGEEGRPMTQFPETFRDISRQLEAMDLHGTVVMVAAGFVGKRYLSLIKQRGGIAIDVGSVADDWARSLAYT